MDRAALPGPWRRRSLTLRQTLLLGAGLGIFLPALVLAYFQISSTFDSVALRCESFFSR